jgi:hypothetical protein
LGAVRVRLPTLAAGGAPSHRTHSTQRERPLENPTLIEGRVSLTRLHARECGE